VSKKSEQDKKRVEIPDNWVDMSEDEQDEFLDEFIRSVFPPPQKD
jgi:hypothetical protein